jgi:multidrug efflux system outer membrane protein
MNRSQRSLGCPRSPKCRPSGWYGEKAGSPVVSLFALACSALASSASASPDVQASPAGADSPGDAPAPPSLAASPASPAVTHAYTLAECLALTEHNSASLSAARARLAYVHAQLDEARWTPFWQWTANAGASVLPPITGTAIYTSSSPTARNVSFTDGIEPIIHFDLNGVIPLYTFGKITAAKEAATAGVRVSEWDLEKTRQQTRMDVRRAFYGLLLARDAAYLSTEITRELDKAIKGVRDKIAKDDKAVGEVDAFRLEVLKEEITARAGDAARGEAVATAALRFLTGVETGFDIPDEPIKPPTTPLAPVVHYLAAARVFRPEVNMARAGVVARKAQVDLARARMLPDIGIALGTDYTRAPSATTQSTAWAFDPFNHFYYTVGLGARWSLDIMPAYARMNEASSQLEETRAQERLALGGLAVEVETAYAAVVEAKGREESWSRAEHKAKQWIATVQGQIDLGTSDEKGLAEPLRAYINARAQHLVAIMDYNLAQSQLALASGWDAAAP